MAAHLFTDAQRDSILAHNDARRKALGEIPEYDAGRVGEALAAVYRAHPVDDDLRAAFSRITAIGAGNPLGLVEEATNCRLLRPGAPWGSVVYRTSYGDDAAWERMLARIGEVARTSLEDAFRPDLLALHQLVVMDDRARFEDATPDLVRGHFRKWAVEELGRHWREPPMPEDKVGEAGIDDEVVSCAGTRYNFCLLVDDICLESLDKMWSPVVKLVRRSWVPYGEEELDDLRGEEEEDDEDNPGWEGGVTNNEFEDVGWMYGYVTDYVSLQNRLHDEGNFADDYMRPPLMQFLDGFHDAPGSWRRVEEPSDVQ